MAQVITANDAQGQRWQQWHDQVAAALKGAAPPATVEQLAESIANQVRTAYVAATAKGATDAAAADQVAGYFNQLLGHAKYTYHLVDADGNPTSATGDAQTGATDTTAVSTADVDKAVDQYRTGIDKANQTYSGIVGYKPDPTANQTYTPVDAPTVAAQKAHATSYDATHAQATGYTAGQAAATLVPGAATISPADRIKAALQAQTTAASTDLATGQSDESRAEQQQNLSNLEASAAGQGAVQQAAAAREKQLLTRSGQQANGLVQQARGSERRGARLSAILSAANANLTGEQQIQEQAATEAQAAQTAVSQNLQQQRTTDVDVAAKQADLSQQRNLAQANLDQAKASGDQQAINAANLKLADLDQQQKEFNATQTQDVAKTNAASQTQTAQFDVGEQNKAASQTSQQETDVSKANAAADTGASKDAADSATDVSKVNAQLGTSTAVGNADRTVQTAESNNTQGLAAQTQNEAQRVANERLKLDAQKAITDNAQGLLNEAQREAALKQAQEQMALAEKAFQAARDDAARAQANTDRSFWSQVYSSILTGATALGAAAISHPATTAAVVAAAHGGLVTKPTRLLVGEAGPELIIPVDDDVDDELAARLAIARKPFDRSKAPRLAGLLAALSNPSKAEPDAIPELPPHVAGILALGYARARKAAR